MPAYLVVEHKITDPAKFQEYGDKVRPLVANYGGQSLARGNHRVLETNHWLPDRLILFEFPDMEALNTWYNSPEYQPLIALRQSATDMSKDMMIALNVSGQDNATHLRGGEGNDARQRASALSS